MLNENSENTIDFKRIKNSNSFHQSNQNGSHLFLQNTESEINYDREKIFLSFYLVFSILFSLFLGILIGKYWSIEDSKSPVYYSEVK